MKNLFALLLILCALPVFAGCDAEIFKTSKGCGLKSLNGNVILKPEYQEIHRLSYTPSKRFIIPMHAMDETPVKQTDLLKIKKNNYWGAANNEGKVIVPCKYDKIEIAGNGEIVLYTGEKVQYANPFKNAAKNTKNTVITIVALPVTIIGTVMLPIEIMSKLGK